MGADGGCEASRYHKKQLVQGPYRLFLDRIEDWMDLWDLGVLIANRAYQAGRWSEFYKSREIIQEARREPVGSVSGGVSRGFEQILLERS